MDKRDSADAATTRRRRQCATCSHRFTTHERPEMAALMVVKRDRRRQEFDRAKLRHSLQVACAKRPIGAETIESLVEGVESELRARDLPEVPSSVIGDLVMDKLRRLDKVAYIRFASVYRAFADVSSFEDELRHLIEQAGAEDASAAAATALAGPVRVP